MNLARKCIVMFCLVVFMLPLAACEKEGPMEKAGKKMDKAVDDLQEQGKKLFE